MAAAAGTVSALRGSRSAPDTRSSSWVTPPSGWSCSGSFGWTWELPPYLYLASVGLALAVIDLDTKRLPNALTLPSYVVLGLLFLVPAAADGDWSAYLRAWLAAAPFSASTSCLAVIYPSGMGFGDVKLAGVLGLALGWLGWGELVVGGFLGFLLGASDRRRPDARRQGGPQEQDPVRPVHAARCFAGHPVGRPALGYLPRHPHLGHPHPGLAHPIGPEPEADLHEEMLVSAQGRPPMRRSSR